jgi:hypothetical protein
MTNGHGHTEQVELSPPREAVVEQGLRIQQATAEERDQLRRRLDQAHADITAFKVALEAQAAQLTQADSRVETATARMDEAVRRCAEVETVLASIMALGRAFNIRHQPHITGDGDHEQQAPRDRRLDMAGIERFDNRGDVG